MEIIGQRIRIERQQRRFTLEQLSQKVGLSKSHLSQIERGLALPSVSTLKKVSSVFGISVVELFDESFKSHRKSANHSSARVKNNNNENVRQFNFTREVRVVRSNRRKAIKLPGSLIHYDLLTPDLNRSIEVLAVKASPGENTGDEPLIDSPGEKFGLVVNGRIEVTVENDVYILESGDTIYHPSDFPHSWRCLGDEPAEIIWVMTPPSF